MCESFVNNLGYHKFLHTYIFFKLKTDVTDAKIINKYIWGIQYIL